MGVMGDAAWVLLQLLLESCSLCIHNNTSIRQQQLAAATNR